MRITLIGPPPNRESRIARWVLVLAAGAVVLAFPVPEGVDARGWRMLAIFAATVTGVMFQPVAIGALVLLGVAITVVTQTVSLPTALSGWAAPVMWLIVSAFLLARAVVGTGLGRRIALLFIRWFGSSALRLAYALAGADVVTSPVIPSDTARMGGVIFPITRSLAETYESYPGPTARRLGAYLMQSTYHAGCTTSATFMTAMAANLLSVEFAMKYAQVKITWLGWLAASCVPAALSLGLLPWLIHRLDPPELTHTPEAQRMADAHLREMGPASGREKILLVILGGMIAGWAAQPLHGLHAAVIAFIGLFAIVLTGVLPWDDLLGETRAWDVLIWLGALIMMAEALSTYGVIKSFSDHLQVWLQGWHAVAALVAVVVAYTYIHYLFASMTAQITALYPAFLLLAVGAGAPPMVAALTLAFFSCMNASLTHYGTAPAPIFFGAGYVDQVTWWRVGFFVVAAQLLIWLGVGLLWWRVLGFW